MSSTCLHVLTMWFFNAWNQGCCCQSDDHGTEVFDYERPVAYSAECEAPLLPDPMAPPRSIVARPVLRKLMAYYHLSDMGTGVKTRQFERTMAFIDRYYRALNAAETDGWGQFMSLWAHDSKGIWMEPFAGAAPLRSRADIANFLESFPTMTVQKLSYTIAQDESQGACASVFHLQDPPPGVPSTINSVEIFKLNPAGQLIFLRMFWHPSEIGGATKTSQYEITAKHVRSFTEALNSSASGSIGCTWEEQPKEAEVEFHDPVGTLARSTRSIIDTYSAGLPPFTATLRMVRIGQDELKAAAVINIAFPQSKLLPSFPIIFTFDFV